MITRSQAKKIIQDNEDLYWEYLQALSSMSEKMDKEGENQDKLHAFDILYTEWSKYNDALTQANYFVNE